MDLKILPKLLINGRKLERVAPNQKQAAWQQDIPYKVKYGCKFGKKLWLDKLALYIFSKFRPLFPLFNLKTLPKIHLEVKMSDNSYKQIKYHQLGNASRSVHG